MTGHRHTTHEHEHDFEVAPGLPEPLPADEKLLWQGAPDWRLLARHAFHARTLAIYFAVILAIRLVSQWADSGSIVAAAIATVWLLPLAALVVGMACLMAYLSSRTTVYTLTDRRLVMRVGIVLTLTFNLPFKRIDAAALHRLRSGQDDGSGDIALTLAADTSIAYVHLWPHARPWKVARTQPMLRSLRDAAQVATLLTEAWAKDRQLAAAPAAVAAELEADRLTPATSPRAEPRWQPEMTASAR